MDNKNISQNVTDNNNQKNSQNNYINSEIEIDLRDMICYCFLHWRSALALMIVVGMLFGCYSTLKNYRAEKSVIDAYTRYDAAVADGINDDDKLKAAVNNDTVYANIKNQNKITSLNSQIAELNKDINKNEKYLSEAELIKIDPNKEYFSNTVIAITVSDTAKSGTLSSIMSAYKANLLSQECKDKINNETNIKSRYLNDLIDISASTDGMTDADKTGNVGTLTIYTIGKSESDVKSMTSAMLSDFSDVSSKVSKTFGNFDTNVMDTNYGITANDFISEKTDDINTKVSTDRSSLNQVETTLSALTPTPRPTIDKSSLVKGLIKKSVTGAIMIFLLYGFLLCLIYAMSDRAITKNQLISRYRLFELGTFANANEKIYRRNGAFDKWLRRKMNVYEKIDDRIAVFDMILANLNVYAAGRMNIIITGSASMDEKVKLIVELRARNHDITFLPCESLTNKAEDRSKLASADAVIFFEKYGSSRYADMSKEVMLTGDADICIIGYITE